MRYFRTKRRLRDEIDSLIERCLDLEYELILQHREIARLKALLAEKNGSQ